MKLLVTMITYNRQKYSAETLLHLSATIQVPHYINVVDNASTDGTKLWLADVKKEGKIDDYIINDENLYPGEATNIGWREGLLKYPEATHLMRLDNDMYLQHGWDTAAEDYFRKIPELGQLGIDHDALDHPRAKLREIEINGKIINPWPGCVGGPNIIPKKVYDLGVRYEPLRWDDGRNSPMQEDSNFSRKIQAKGYLTGHMTERLAWTFANESNWSEFPSYYKKTMSERGYLENLEKIK